MEKQTAADERALKDFLRLACTGYSGRGIINGRTARHLVQGCFIQGRSEPTRNRIYEEAGSGELRTALADPDKPGGGPLTIYPAMLEASRSGNYAVSNGAQTHRALQIVADDDLNYSLMIMGEDFSYEPDSLHTPRITGTIRLVEKDRIEFQMLLLKKSVADDSCEKFHFVWNEMPAGYGRCLTTYAVDDTLMDAGPHVGGFAALQSMDFFKRQRDPISFVGEPLFLPIPDSQEEMLDLYWKALDCDNMISLAVKYIDIATGESNIMFKNKYEKVAAEA